MSSCLGCYKRLNAYTVEVCSYVGPMPPLDIRLARRNLLYKCLSFSPCYNKVVAVAHSAHGLHDFTLVVFDDFDALQVLHSINMLSIFKYIYSNLFNMTYNAQIKAPFCQIG